MDKISNSDPFGDFQQQVEKVFNTSNPDPAELEKAKKMLKVWSISMLFQFHFSLFHLSFPLQGKSRFIFNVQDHEQALVDAISRLTYASDGESGNEYMCT